MPPGGATAAVLAGGLHMAAASFSADAFDPKDPAAFYLSDDGREELEALADATLAVGGARLLVHRSVRP